MAQSKTIRLTDYLRREITSRLLDHRFSAEEADIKHWKQVLAHDCYLAAFTIEERERMASLPEGWLGEESRIGVKFNQDTSDLAHLSFLEPRRFPAKARHVALILPKTHQLSERYFALKQRENVMETARKELKGKISNLLGRVTTLGKLISEWPEIEPLVRDFKPTAPANLPATILSDLNKALGLPPEEDDANAPV